MTTTTRTLSRLAPLVLAALAIACVAGAVSIFRDATRPLRANGFERLSSPGSTCDFDDPAWQRRATRTIEPEPFAEEREHPETCVAWRAYWAISRPARLEVEIESDDDGIVVVDGHPLVQHPGVHARSSRTATRDFEPGVHPFEVRWVNRGGGGYLRVMMQDRREAYMPGVLPLDRDAFFVSRADAERALAERLPARRQPERARDAALLAALACVLAWLALRAWRRRGEAPLRRFALVDLAIGAGLGALALWLRTHRIHDTDLAWDELWYTHAGDHWVRSYLQLGDWSADAYRHNFEHPPVTKFFAGIGVAIGGVDGARWVSAVLGAASVALTYATGKVLFDRRAGTAAALLLATMPHIVAHARLVGHETVIVFFWCALLLALAVWLRSVGFGEGSGERMAHGDFLAPLAGGAAMVLGVLTRLTFVWCAPVIAFALVWGRRRELARGTLPIPLGAIAGTLLALAAVVALWPWLHQDPMGHLGRTLGHWGGHTPTEYFLGERVLGPPFSYYPVLFVVTTPALVVLAAIVGAGRGLSVPRWHAATLLTIVALLAPFLHGLSPLRRDLARYVIQAWPALALLGGVALSWAGAELVARARAGARASIALGLAPAAAMALYAGAELRSVEPFPLDYYSDLVGGPGEVARRELFDVSWWAEGVGHAVEWVNEHAREGARVRIDAATWDVRPRLRDDLVEVQFRSRVPAAYVVTNYHLYGDPPPEGCERVHHVEVRGAPLASVWECPEERR